MALINVQETNFSNPMKKIFKFPDHYVAITALFPAKNAVDLGRADGRKGIKAGTVVKGALTNPKALQAVAAGTSSAGTTFDGVVVNDEVAPFGTNVSSSSNEYILVTVCIHGFLRKGALQIPDYCTCENKMIAIL